MIRFQARPICGFCQNTISSNFQEFMTGWLCTKSTTPRYFHVFFFGLSGLCQGAFCSVPYLTFGLLFQWPKWENGRKRWGFFCIVCFFDGGRLTIIGPGFCCRLIQTNRLEKGPDTQCTETWLHTSLSRGELMRLILSDNSSAALPCLDIWVRFLIFFFLSFCLSVCLSLSLSLSNFVRRPSSWLYSTHNMQEMIKETEEIVLRWSSRAHTTQTPWHTQLYFWLAKAMGLTFKACKTFEGKAPSTTEPENHIERTCLCSMWLALTKTIQQQVRHSYKKLFHLCFTILPLAKPRSSEVHFHTPKVACWKHPVAGLGKKAKIVVNFTPPLETIEEGPLVEWRRQVFAMTPHHQARSPTKQETRPPTGILAISEMHVQCSCLWCTVFCLDGCYKMWEQLAQWDPGWATSLQVIESHTPTACRNRGRGRDGRTKAGKFIWTKFSVVWTVILSLWHFCSVPRSKKNQILHIQLEMRTNWFPSPCRRILLKGDWFTVTPWAVSWLSSFHCIPYIFTKCSSHKGVSNRILKMLNVFPLCHKDSAMTLEWTNTISIFDKDFALVLCSEKENYFNAAILTRSEWRR